MAIGADGRAVVGLYDNTTHADQTVEFDLEMMRCSDVACTSSLTVTVDETAAISAGSSVAVGGFDGKLSSIRSSLRPTPSGPLFV
jgi:hypothetical protein